MLSYHYDTPVLHYCQCKRCVILFFFNRYFCERATRNSRPVAKLFPSWTLRVVKVFAVPWWHACDVNAECTMSLRMHFEASMATYCLWQDTLANCLQDIAHGTHMHPFDASPPPLLMPLARLPSSTNHPSLFLSHSLSLYLFLSRSHACMPLFIGSPKKISFKLYLE